MPCALCTARAHGRRGLLFLQARGCPYFASRVLAADASLVFCPYNYLIDPAVRDAMDVKVAGAVVIFDEAHNIEDVSRDAASYTSSLTDLASAAQLAPHSRACACYCLLHLPNAHVSSGASTAATCLELPHRRFSKRCTDLDGCSPEQQTA